MAAYLGATLDFVVRMANGSNISVLFLLPRSFLLKPLKTLPWLRWDLLVFWL